VVPLLLFSGFISSFRNIVFRNNNNVVFATDSVSYKGGLCHAATEGHITVGQPACLYLNVIHMDVYKHINHTCMHYVTCLYLLQFLIGEIIK